MNIKDWEQLVRKYDFRKNRSRRTIYACDKCNRMLCPTCFKKQDSHKSLDHLIGFLSVTADKVFIKKFTLNTSRPSPSLTPHKEIF